MNRSCMVASHSHDAFPDDVFELLSPVDIFHCQLVVAHDAPGLAYPQVAGDSGEISGIEAGDILPGGLQRDNHLPSCLDLAGGQVSHVRGIALVDLGGVLEDGLYLAAFPGGEEEAQVAVLVIIAVGEGLLGNRAQSQCSYRNKVHDISGILEPFDALLYRL